MKLIEAEAVQWKDGDSHHVGRVMRCDGDRIDNECGIGPDDITREDATRESYGTYTALIRHSHTGELEFVEERLLTPYPSEPIPEPTNTGK